MPKSKPPPFVQIDPNAINALATATDQSGYALSDADLARRLPNLVAGKNYAVNNAVSNLNGQQDRALTSAFNQSGFKGTNLGSNAFQQSRNLGQPILAKEQRDRNYFQRLFQSTPQRAFGLNSTDVAHIALANTGNKTQYDLANFGSKINQMNAQSAQANAFGQTVGRTVGGIVQQGISSYGQGQQQSTTPYTQSNYLNPNTYNYQPAGGYYNPGFQPSSYGGTYEGTINNQPVYRAEPVNSNYTSSANTSGGGF